MLKWKYNASRQTLEFDRLGGGTLFPDPREEIHAGIHSNYQTNVHVDGYQTMPKLKHTTVTAADARLTDYGFLEPRGRAPKVRQIHQEYSTQSLHRRSSMKTGQQQQDLYTRPVKKQGHSTAAFQDISNTAVPRNTRRHPSMDTAPRYAVKKTLERSISCASSLQKFSKADSGYGGGEFLNPRTPTARLHAQEPDSARRASVKRTHSFKLQQRPAGVSRTPTPIRRHLPDIYEDQPPVLPPKSRVEPPVRAPRVRAPPPEPGHCGSYSQTVRSHSRDSCRWTHEIPQEFHFRPQAAPVSEGRIRPQPFGASSHPHLPYLPPRQREPERHEPTKREHCHQRKTPVTLRPAEVTESRSARHRTPESRRFSTEPGSCGTLSRLTSVKADIVMGKGILKLSVYMNFGMLTIHVNQARHLQSLTAPTCRSHIKLSLVPDATRRTKCSTSIVMDTNHPVFDEKFSFELLPCDIKKRVLVSVWNTSDTSQYTEFMGCMSFGVESIFEGKKEIDDWYYLLKEEVGRKKHLKAIVKKGDPVETPSGKPVSRSTSHLEGVISGTVTEHLPHASPVSQPQLTYPTTRPPLPTRSASMRALPTGNHTLRRPSPALPPSTPPAEGEDIYLSPLCCEKRSCEEGKPHPACPRSCGGGAKGKATPSPSPTARGVARSLSVMNLSTQQQQQRQQRHTSPPHRRDTSSLSHLGALNTSVKHDSFFSIPTPEFHNHKSKSRVTPRIVYVDQSQGKGLAAPAATPPSSSADKVAAESAADRLDGLAATVWPDQLVMNNTYESLGTLDNLSAGEDDDEEEEEEEEKSPGKEDEVRSKRKRDAANDSVLSNTSFKHPVKRRKVEEMTEVEETLALPFARKWRFRDSFRFAIFGKKKGKKLM